MPWGSELPAPKPKPIPKVYPSGTAKPNVDQVGAAYGLYFRRKLELKSGFRLYGEELKQWELKSFAIRAELEETLKRLGLSDAIDFED